MRQNKSFRIAVGGFHVECSSYNPMRTRERDFELLTGPKLLESPYFSALGTYAAEFVPTLYAHALPGAPISAEAYNTIKSGIINGLCGAGRLDGVYLMMHGAAYVEGMEDAEGDLLSAVREAVGETIPISVSYDLHGNLSDRVMNAIDMFAAYRTAPHIDVEDTHRRALDQLFRCLETNQRPHLCWCPIPVVLPGERTSTEDQPARELYAKLSVIDAIDGILDASMMVGYVWVDEPRITAAIVIVGTDKSAMENAADGLALDYWNARGSFMFGSTTGSIEECVEEAAKPGKSPFILADSGDNPTGGGVGDRIDVLRTISQTNVSNVVLAGIADAPAVEAAFDAGEGNSAGFSIGGTLDAETTEPLAIKAEVVKLVEASSHNGRQAVLRFNDITFVVTENRQPFHKLSDFHDLGLRPEEADVVVVKSGYLVPDIRDLAARNMMALSPGVVDQDVGRQLRQRSGSGIFPFEEPKAFVPKVRWVR